MPTFAHLRWSQFLKGISLDPFVVEQKLGELLGVPNNMFTGLLRSPLLPLRRQIGLKAVRIQLRQEQYPHCVKCSSEATDNQFDLGRTDFPVFKRLLKILQMLGQSSTSE